MFDTCKEKILKSKLTKGIKNREFCDIITPSEYQNMVDQIYCWYYIQNKDLQWPDLIKDFNHNQRIILENSYTAGTYIVENGVEYSLLNLSNKHTLYLKKDGTFDRPKDLAYLETEYGLTGELANIAFLAEASGYDELIMNVINNTASNSIVRKRIFTEVIEKLITSKGIKSTDAEERTKRFIADVAELTNSKVRYNLDKLKEIHPVKTKKRDLTGWGYAKHF